MLQCPPDSHATSRAALGRAQRAKNPMQVGRERNSRTVRTPQWANHSDASCSTESIPNQNRFDKRSTAQRRNFISHSVNEILASQHSRLRLRFACDNRLQQSSDGRCWTRRLDRNNGGAGSAPPRHLTWPSAICLLAAGRRACRVLHEPARRPCYISLSFCEGSTLGCPDFIGAA